MVFETCFSGELIRALHSLGREDAAETLLNGCSLYRIGSSQREDLTGLGQLREVSLTKIPVHLIQDLVLLRPQLESLSLQRCCFTLDSLVSFN